MAAQQVFIALQCSDCSMMQVKQQKKSSNKWVCAVCNQRQSVRKVFARSCLARDVRGFVQRFNMSRSSTGESESPAPAQIGADAAEEYGDSIRCSAHYTCGSRGRTVPRTDWSQYLDPDEEGAVDDVTGGREKRQRLAKGGSSKWSEYLQEDDACATIEAGGMSPDRNVSSDGYSHGQFTEASFDEEVHPDFL
ncbi:unnamed protein product [Spirodela intermedia]|uniref:MRN complex-interacting protein N-terminal domain-containing protein n=1 Tax=Spirodela intermedia TaxID=51605 RepID=A0A7I8J7L1_SPIIN|nr:unnamed protein product [Spirodela intermedia]CAA6666226.1 unnamed protein product [Spirodela intermedia]